MNIVNNILFLRSFADDDALIINQLFL